MWAITICCCRQRINTRFLLRKNKPIFLVFTRMKSFSHSLIKFQCIRNAIYSMKFWYFSSSVFLAALDFEIIRYFNYLRKLLVDERLKMIITTQFTTYDAYCNLMRLNKKKFWKWDSNDNHLLVIFGTYCAGTFTN